MPDDRPHIRCPASAVKTGRRTVVVLILEIRYLNLTVSLRAPESALRAARGQATRSNLVQIEVHLVEIASSACGLLAMTAQILVSRSAVLGHSAIADFAKNNLDRPLR
jgi:hypothetical protein